MKRCKIRWRYWIRLLVSFGSTLLCLPPSLPSTFLSPPFPQQPTNVVNYLSSVYLYHLASPPTHWDLDTTVWSTHSKCYSANTSRLKIKRLPIHPVRKPDIGLAKRIKQSAQTTILTVCHLRLCRIPNTKQRKPSKNIIERPLSPHWKKKVSVSIHDRGITASRQALPLSHPAYRFWMMWEHPQYSPNENTENFPDYLEPPQFKYPYCLLELDW